MNKSEAKNFNLRSLPPQGGGQEGGVDWALHLCPHPNPPPVGEGKTRHFPIPRVLKNARTLRRTMTDAEKLLWQGLRAEQFGVKFRKQHPIGNYIADFACLNPRIIIELDGGQHNEEKNTRRDDERTRFLELQGFKVLRFWNNEVMKNLGGVLEKIYAEIQSRSPLQMRRL